VERAVLHSDQRCDGHIHTHEVAENLHGQFGALADHLNESVVRGRGHVADRNGAITLSGVDRESQAPLDLSSASHLCGGQLRIRQVDGALKSRHSPRRARAARRLPSCMAWTRATGMVCPSSMRSAGKDWGDGRCAARGSASPRSPGTVLMVKSRGVTRSSSSQATGNETGTPGLMRGLYAATTVAPPARVESRNTLP